MSESGREMNNMKETLSEETSEDKAPQKNQDDNSEKDSDFPTRIVFQVYNTKARKLEPYGTMRWNGEEWEAEEDNIYGSVKGLTDEIRGFGGKILTKKNRDFYKPFWHTPPTGWRVDVYPVPPQYRQRTDDEAAR